uniref:Uncharacterized protein n=1 Tax=Davidia involucrata TaxID=16924 RepID=A0A5B7AFK1_DAVIN
MAQDSNCYICTFFSKMIFLDVLSAAASQDSQKRFIHSEVVSTGEVATQADPPPKPVTFFKDLPSGSGNKEGTSLYQKQTTPNDTDTSEGTSSTAPVSQGVEVYKELAEKIQTLLPHADVPLVQCLDSVIAAKITSVSPKLEDDRTDIPEQDTLEKTPSNIRKMISEFENSLAQDTRPHIKPPAVKSQSNRVGTESPLKGVTNPAQLSSVRLKNPFLTGELQQTRTNIMKRGSHIGFDRDSDGTKLPQHTSQLKESSTLHIQSKGTNSSLKNKVIAHKDVDTKEERKSPENLMGTSATETATISGRMFDEHSSSSRHQPCDLFTDQQDSGSTSMGSGRQKKDSPEINVRGASNDKLKSVAYCEDAHNSFESSGAWIFPDDARRLCITTGGKQVMCLMGGCQVEAKSHQGKESISVPENLHLQSGTDVELKRGEKTFHKLRKSRPESSADAASTGPVGQAIKIAIMVGFGALVLLTRQRKPRKSSSNPFFTIPDYMDQQTMTEEELDSKQRTFDRLKLS